MDPMSSRIQALDLLFGVWQAPYSDKPLAWMPMQKKKPNRIAGLLAFFPR